MDVSPQQRRAVCLKEHSVLATRRSGPAPLRVFEDLLLPSSSLYQPDRSSSSVKAEQKDLPERKVHRPSMVSVQSQRPYASSPSPLVLSTKRRV
jgi:hypothetical protein